MAKASLLCDLVGLDSSVSSFESLKTELLHVCLSSSIIYYGVVVRIFTLRLQQSVSLGLQCGYTARTCSSLSISFDVY